MLVEKTSETFYNLMTFSELLLSEGNLIKVKVGGISMFPFIRRGDIAYISKVKEEGYEIGDVIVFKTKEKFIAHRLLSFRFNKSGKYAIPKGDSTLKFDEPIKVDQILGKVIRIKRKHRSIDFTTKKAKSRARNIALMSPYMIPVYWIFRKIFSIIVRIKQVLRKN